MKLVPLPFRDQPARSEARIALGHGGPKQRQTALRRFAAATALALCSACAVGPDYRPPAEPVANAWQAHVPHTAASQTAAPPPNPPAVPTDPPASPSPTPGAALAPEDWWRQLVDPALDGLIQAAAARNPSLAKAAARINQARAQLGLDQAALLPAVSATAQNTAQGDLGHQTQAQHQGRASLDASWELDLFGRLRRERDAGSAALTAREADEGAARLALFAEIAADYVEYRACREIQRYDEAQAESLARTAGLARQTAKAGLSAPADLQLAEAVAAEALSTTRAQQFECEKLVKALTELSALAEGDVRQYLALPTGSALASLGDSTRAPLGFVVQSLPADLLRQRPDVVAAEQAVVGANARIGAAQASRYPSLTLIGSLGVVKLGAENLSQPWSFGPSLNLPLFDGGAGKSRVSGAQADYAVALADYRQSVLHAVREVEEALIHLDSLATREAHAAQSVAGYRAYFRATEQRWRAGGASAMDLELARRSLIGAELNHLALRRERIASWIALYKAVGGGWQASPGDAA